MSYISVWFQRYAPDLTAAIQAALAAIPLAPDAATATNQGTEIGHLATLIAKDYAKESGGNLAAIAGKDFAKETGGNLAAAKTVLDNIYTRQADGNAQTKVTSLPAVIPVHSYVTFALSSVWAVGQLDANVGDGAVAVPAAAFLSIHGFVVNTPAGLPTTLTWYLSQDAAGIIPITPIKSLTLATYEGVTASNYVFAEGFEIEYQRVGAAGPYLCAKLDKGTATVVSRLFHRLAQ